MLTEAELIIHPYSSKDGKSLLDILVNELRSKKWIRFQAAVAFLKRSGNFRNLLEAMHTFIAEGGTIEITFGADTFAGNTRGTDYEAVKLLLSEFECYRPNYLIKNEPSLDRINGSPTFGGEILTGLGQIK
jgi:hypothetical protein